MVPQTAQFVGFAGGINRRDDPGDLAPDEVVEALNFELDRRAQMRVRNGATELVYAGDGTARVRSIFHFRLSNGTDTVIATWGSVVHRFAAGTEYLFGTTTDITNSLTFPSDAQWHWTQFNDLAIGVNGATTGDATVKLSSAAGVLSALGGSPPRGKYVAAWNDRLWIVDSENPSNLVGSAVGDPEDWTTTGRAGTQTFAVGGNDGDEITGILPHRGVMFVFKRRRIYVVRPGTPNNDVYQYSIDLLAPNVGCVGGDTIQPLLDDVVFLSDYGVMSLAAVQQFGDFKQASLSDKLPELSEVSKTVGKFASVVHPTKGQYWLAVPTSTSAGENALIYVFDVATRAWTNFNGAILGSALGIVYESGVPYVYTGGVRAAAGTNYGVWRYENDDAAQFIDDPLYGYWAVAGLEYQKVLLTGAWSMGDALLRKDFLSFGLELGVETNPVALTITYRFDENDEKRKSFDVLFEQTLSGGKWSVAQWSVDRWAQELTDSASLVRTFRGAAGRRGTTVQLRVQSTGVASLVGEANDQRWAGFTVKRFFVRYVPLTRKHVSGEV